MIELKLKGVNYLKMSQARSAIIATAPPPIATPTKSDIGRTGLEIGSTVTVLTLWDASSTDCSRDSAAEINSAEVA